MTVDIPLLENLHGIGDALLKKFAKKGINNQLDLLLHLPRSYQNQTIITLIADAGFDKEVLVEGEIISATITRTRTRQLICQLEDKSQCLTIKFFRFFPNQISRLHSGVKIRCFGRITNYQNEHMMIHPEWKIIPKNKDIPLDKFFRPIYPVIEGFSSKKIADLINQIFSQQLEWLHDLIPENIRARYHLCDFINALKIIHFPEQCDDIYKLEQGDHDAQKRLIFEELLSHILATRIIKKAYKQLNAYKLRSGENLIQEFLSNLPYDLTKAQQKVVKEILCDLSKTNPMARLVQGDVGCGKTVIAAIAILKIVASEKQAVLMAPTEILAKQHYYNFNNWFSKLGIKVGLLINKQKKSKKTELLNDLSTGAVAVIIGTHAVFQESVKYKKLALVIIDEQHRFGVDQRLALISKGVSSGCSINASKYPHQLIMSATPIPRTLAMTVYGDLEISIIDELPPGRKPIKTVAMSNDKRLELIQRLRVNCLDGKQAYWVCTLIEDSEMLPHLQTAENLLAKLNYELPEIKIGLVHGKMKADEKTSVMDAFKKGNIQLLVATTVIEVGVDVPNASIMIIENPERLGLSQLHQLRGRVGRSEASSACVLLYHGRLSGVARERIDLLRQYNDGFIIAEKDLKLRGPGDVIGTRQTGDIFFKLADLSRDYYLFEELQKVADEMLQYHLEESQHIVDYWFNRPLTYL